MFAKVRLHENATRESLALARIVLFLIAIVYVLVYPLHKLAYLPIELFHPFGIFRLLPESI